MDIGTLLIYGEARARKMAEDINDHDDYAAAQFSELGSLFYAALTAFYDYEHDIKAK